MIGFLQRIKTLLESVEPDTLKLSLADCHHPGLFSLVIGGTEPGKLTRVFIADAGLPIGAIQLHQHRYGIQLTALQGLIFQHEAIRCDAAVEGAVQMSVFNYKSPLNGGGGLRFSGDATFVMKMYPIPVGGSLEMYHTDFHTISCDPGSIWIVEELGYKSDSSSVLGVPFETEGLYITPSGDVTEAYMAVVSKVVNSLLQKFETNGY